MPIADPVNIWAALLRIALVIQLSFREFFAEAQKRGRARTGRVPFALIGEERHPVAVITCQLSVKGQEAGQSSFSAPEGPWLSIIRMGRWCILRNILASKRRN